MRIKGISEIVLNVDDLPIMREFYQRVLKFELLSESNHEAEDGQPGDGAATIAFLIVADGTPATPLAEQGHPPLLALIDHRRHTFSRGQIDSLRQSSSHLNHVAFEIATENYASWLAHLHDQQLETMETEFRSFHAKAIFFQDPEGNRIELICPKTNSF